jgi:subtilisin family serine protease
MSRVFTRSRVAVALSLLMVLSLLALPASGAPNEHANQRAHERWAEHGSPLGQLTPGVGRDNPGQAKKAVADGDAMIDGSPISWSFNETGLARLLPESLGGRAVAGPVNLDRVERMFIELDEPSVAEFVASSGRMPSAETQRGQAKKVAAQQSAVAASLAAAGADLGTTLQVGANGFYADIALRDIPTILAIAGVKGVGKVVEHERTNGASVPFIGAPAVWDAVGDGEGITIGIIDTGIDYLHENFGGSGDPADYAANDPTIIEADSFPTTKVAGGYDFTGDNYDASGDDGPTTPTPDDDPLDCNGHGTHVAGTAAGIGTSEIGPGVAKGATLYALKVFGCEGSTLVTAQAIEWAMDPNGDGSMDDHLDVINMSLGSPFGHPGDPSAIASENAVAAGVVVVASAGNEGSAPYVTGSPGVAPSAISVAASIDDGFEVLAISADIDGNVTLMEAAEGGITAPLSDVGPITADLASADPILACDPIANDLTGKIALIERGACFFSTKILNAQAAGAVGVIVYTYPGEDPIIMGGDSAGITIPGVMVSRADGEALAGGTSVSVALSADTVIAKPELADTLAGFTSRGPGAGTTFKPDVAAPGFAIFSAAVGTGTGGANASGTSMAAPHVAGMAALILTSHPDATPEQVKAMMQNSSRPSVLPYPVARQGVGVVQADVAAGLTSWASPGGLSFGRVNPATPTVLRKTITVHNDGDSTRTFAVSHEPLHEMEGVEVLVDSTSVKVRPGGSKEVRVRLEVTPAAMAYDNGFYSHAEVDGWFVIDDGVDALRVGYMAAVDPASDFEVTPKRNGELKIHNNGGAAGFAEGFTLAAVDGLVTDGHPYSFDALGVRTANLFGDDVVEFGVLADGPWDTLSVYEYDILIDADGDGAPETVVVAADLGLLTGGDPAGVVVTAVFDLTTGAFPLDWYVIADLNDHSAVLTVTRDLILPEGDSDFDFVAYAFDLRSDALDVTIGSVDLDALVEPESAYVGLLPGGSMRLSVEGSGSMLWLYQNNPVGEQGSYFQLP